jgi:uncharacterized protein (TIGR02266 family)
MSRYWIADARRNILGPVDERVLAELAAAGKLAGIELVSREGGPWVPPSSFPEIAALFVAPGDEARVAREREEAQRLALVLDSLREKPIHEVFGVAAGADLEALRRAYFDLAKRYHPARAPAEAAPELKQAYLEVFQFLATRLHEEERRRTCAGPARPYVPEDFLGLERRQAGRVEARVKVTPAVAGMFTENRTVNLSSGGFFLATDRLVPLETRLDLILSFEAEGREVKATGVVVWANGESRRGQPRGFGVRFVMLRAADRRFLEEWVARIQAETADR